MPKKIIAISDFCQTGSGGTPLRSESRYYDGDIPWIKSGELREGLINSAEEFITEDALRETNVKLVPAGAILVAMYGATVGRVAKLGIPATTNQAVCHVIPDKSICDPQYLFHCLQSKMPEFLARRVGGAQPNISQGIIRETLIPLPSLDEQRRIAAILDKADALREKRRQAIAKLDTLLQSVFLEMFGDPVRNPKGFPKIPLGELIKVKSGEFLPEKSFGKNGIYPVYGGNGISGYHDQFMFETPMIVIGRVGYYCGAVHVTEPWSWITDNALYVVEKSDKLTDVYLAAALVNAKLNRYAGKSAQPLISGGRIYPVPIVVPPHESQEKYRTILQAVEAFKFKAIEAEKKTSELFSSLQQRAFTGQLFTEKAAAAAQQELFSEMAAGEA